ncbi:uncharacterized protein TRIADDRAFT_56167 [Trichoplax adhaerens]|uniref:Hydroxylysine kinase n=1 Tax=Trichoplax adhaerens TaxID=10228 RepID=B3RXD2_TRIAD|nr:hypothetical protein TRIADDRAFT_56167 [Trichoplax adhaerens]EDV24398.1 hypothetical protein TRIADDRAFT_56167 [Trichoplax adhaerens]|eukprot:XP_002112288.1 hypothetical protein TRIADDRAFT_56167 [Trichoplax adhaerens]
MLYRSWTSALFFTANNPSGEILKRRCLLHNLEAWIPLVSCVEVIQDYLTMHTVNNSILMFSRVNSFLKCSNYDRVACKVKDFKCFHSSVYQKIPFTALPLENKWHQKRHSFKTRPPNLPKDQVKEILTNLIGANNININNLKELPSYADRNYYFQLDYPIISRHFGNYQDSSVHTYSKMAKENQSYVLKILSCPDQESYDLHHARLCAMKHLYNTGINCPSPINLANQKWIKTVKLPQQKLNAGNQSMDNFEEHIAYLLTYVDGQTVATIQPNEDLLYQIGGYAGLLDKNLQNFSDDRLKVNRSIWSIHNFLELKPYIQYCREDKRDFMERIYDRCASYFQVNMNNLRINVIHNDLNIDNIIIKQNNGVTGYKVAGIIDFGEVDYAFTISELAIMVYYAMWIINQDPLTAAGHLIAGFNSVFPLTDIEYKGLYTMILARLFQSITLVDYHISCFPENEYLKGHYDKKLKIYDLLSCASERKVYKIWDEIMKIRKN